MDLSGLHSEVADILSTMDLTHWFSLTVAPFLSSWSAFSLPKYCHLGLLWCAVSCICYSYLYNHQRMLFCSENKESWNNYDLRKVGRLKWQSSPTLGGYCDGFSVLLSRRKSVQSAASVSPESDKDCENKNSLFSWSELTFLFCPGAT